MARSSVSGFFICMCTSDRSRTGLNLISACVLCSPGDERELIVSKSEPKAIIAGFDRSKEYSVKITAVRGAEQSKPLMGRYSGETLHSETWLFYMRCSICSDWRCVSVRIGVGVRGEWPQRSAGL